MKVPQEYLDKLNASNGFTPNGKKLRSIAEAAKQAVEGSDETLWQACLDNADDSVIRQVLILEFDAMREAECERIIRSFSPEQRKLYSIGEE